MTEKFLKNLIAMIEDPDYIVMWNDGYDKYIILNDYVHIHDDELKVYFKDHSVKYIDLYGCFEERDFLYFKEKR